MKLIPMADIGQFKMREIINTVMGTSTDAVKFDEMRKRSRVLDALDAAGEDELLLEDADHTFLKASVEKFQFRMVGPELLRDLVRAISLIVDAKAPQ